MLALEVESHKYLHSYSGGTSDFILNWFDDSTVNQAEIIEFKDINEAVSIIFKEESEDYKKKRDSKEDKFSRMVRE